MNAGYADVDITPDPGEEMTGYGYFLNRRATGTLDPVRARALALEEGGERAVIVQLDLLGLSKDFVADVRAEAQQRLGLPPSHLMLHCTHTHSGPSSIPTFGCGSPSEHYLFLLRQRLIPVIEKALSGPRPVRAMQRFDVDWPEGFAHNRVGCDDLDTRVRGLRIELDGARPILLISYACHPVTLGANREFSADYCGAVLREFNAYGVRALYLNGCCGDINPATHAYAWGAGTRETLLIYGRDLAAVVRRALADAAPCQPGPVRACSRMIPLEHEPTTPDRLREDLKDVQTALRSSPTDGPRRVDALWHERMIRLHESQAAGRAAEAEIQAIACGDIVFVGISAETFTRLGQIVRAGVPDRHLLIAATSNGVVGYIGTEDDVRRKGYASFSACKLYGMAVPTPGAGEKWAAQGVEVVADAAGARG